MKLVTNNLNRLLLLKIELSTQAFMTNHLTKGDKYIFQGILHEYIVNIIKYLLLMGVFDK